MLSASPPPTTSQNACQVHSPIIRPQGACSEATGANDGVAIVISGYLVAVPVTCERRLGRRSPAPRPVLALRDGAARRVAARRRRLGSIICRHGSRPVRPARDTRVAPKQTGGPRGASMRTFGQAGRCSSNRSADRLPLPALTARDVPPALVAIPTRTFDLAHEFGNQAAIRCIAKASAECVDLSMSQIQGAALLHRITTKHAVEIEQRYYDQ